MMKREKQHEVSSVQFLSAVLFSIPLLFILSVSCLASDYRVSFGLGLGGAGITQQPTTTSTASSVNTTTTTTTSTVQKSEGPGSLSFEIEKIMTDRVTLLLEHARGFRLGPFSSGVSFTGIFSRYYFGTIPWGSSEIKNETQMFVKGIHPFVGLGAGVATGTITRTDDLVPEVDGSGVFFGFRAGADIPLSAKGYGLRPELIFSGTLISSGKPVTSLSYLFLGCSFYFQI